MKICSIAECRDRAIARGWCSKHYDRWRRRGDPLIARTKSPGCKENGCDREVVGWGWCSRHYSAYVDAPRRKAARKTAREGRVCANCQLPIDTSRVRAIFCSRECKVAARRADGRQRESSMRHYYRKHYGLTLDEVDALRANGCTICGAKSGGGRHGQLHIDHDHETGRVRGALCDGCNTGLGKFRDDPARLRRAADYLEMPLGVLARVAS